LIANAPQFAFDVMRLLSHRVRERDRAYELVNVDAIIGSIAHEIRQPLAAIAAYAGAALRFLQKEPPDYNEVREALAMISTQSRHASEVFDGIRALFKKVDVERVPIDINAIASEVLQSLRAELAELGVAANSELSFGLPFVQGNRNQLHQVVFNLVQNAIEAMRTTSDKSRVLRVVSERAVADAIALTVKDTGPGIKTSQLPRVFDPFLRRRKMGWDWVSRFAGQLSRAMVVSLLYHRMANREHRSDSFCQFCPREKAPADLNEPLIWRDGYHRFNWRRAALVALRRDVWMLEHW
jgi:signal transduction histidine kinase